MKVKFLKMNLKRFVTHRAPLSTTQKFNFVKPQIILFLNLSRSKCFKRSFYYKDLISSENSEPFQNFCLGRAIKMQPPSKDEGQRGIENERGARHKSNFERQQ